METSSALAKKEKGFFESFSESVLQLYILLSTCNFPDIMLEAMEFSKFAIIYFVVYISIHRAHALQIKLNRFCAPFRFFPKEKITLRNKTDPAEYSAGSVLYRDDLSVGSAVYREGIIICDISERAPVRSSSVRDVLSQLYDTFIRKNAEFCL